MSASTPPIYDVLDALRAKRDLEAAPGTLSDLNTVRVAELGRYVDIMRSHGEHRADRVERFPGNANADQGDIVRVTFDTAADLWRAVRRNINKDGVFIQCDDFPSIDTVVDLELQVASPKVSFSSPAKVIWVNPTPRSGRPVGMGLKFVWRRQDQRGLFREFMLGDLPPERLRELA